MTGHNVLFYWQFLVRRRVLIMVSIIASTMSDPFDFSYYTNASLF